MTNFGRMKAVHVSKIINVFLLFAQVYLRMVQESDSEGIRLMATDHEEALVLDQVRVLDGNISRKKHEKKTCLFVRAFFHLFFFNPVHGGKLLF